MLIKKASILKKEGEKIKIIFLAFFSPLLVTSVLSSYMEQPCNIFGGIVYLGLLSLIYRNIGGLGYQTFKVIASIVLFLFLLSLGGWADQGIVR